MHIPEKQGATQPFTGSMYVILPPTSPAIQLLTYKAPFLHAVDTNPKPLLDTAVISSSNISRCAVSTDEFFRKVK